MRIHSLAQLLPPLIVTIWVGGFVVVLLTWFARWRRISVALRQSTALREGREAETLRRVEQLAGLRRPIELLMSPATLEPGIFGIVKPVLLWPREISERLDDAQLEAILVHEIWHARRRDNLTAAIHMLVEAIFWFHPLVWWLGARLLEERELACDEAVLALGSDRKVYADSILKTCEFCVESPLACVSGVTGADLKRRVVRIVSERMALNLNLGRKLLLTATGIAAVTGPIVFGLMNGPQARGQSVQTTGAPLPAFEAVSVRRSPAGENTSFKILPNRLTVTSYLIKPLICIAYGHDLGEFGFINLRRNQVVGGPDWIYPDEAKAIARQYYEGYDIDAKVDDSAAGKFGKDCGAAFYEGSCGYREQMILMLQSLLADRFKLKVRRETREVPVYALVAAEGGPKFLHTTFALPDPPTSWRRNPPCPAGKECFERYMSMDQVAEWLSLLYPNGRPVIDKTGLKGGYFIKFQWVRNPNHPGTQWGLMDGKPDPPLFTLLQEQLGLKLEPINGPVEFLIIDHIERPKVN
jgi:uncharacterized protein (TIGR03435 family)